MLKEFKEFALKGNVIDLAVGVIIGGAFGKIVTSLVNDILMPIIGILIGGLNFNGLKYVIHEAVVDGGTVVTEESAILYGAFIQNIIDFLIIAFSIFIAIKFINKTRKKEEAPEVPQAPTPTDVELLTEIRDLLKAK